VSLTRLSPVYRSVCFSKSDTETVKNWLALYNNQIVTYWAYCRSVGRKNGPRINRKGYEVQDVRSCDLIEVYRRFRGSCCQLHRRGWLSIYGYNAGNGSFFSPQKYRSVEHMDYHSLIEEIGSVCWLRIYFFIYCWSGILV